MISDNEQQYIVSRNAIREFIQCFLGRQIDKSQIEIKRFYNQGAYTYMCNYLGAWFEVCYSPIHRVYYVTRYREDKQEHYNSIQFARELKFGKEAKHDID